MARRADLDHQYGRGRMWLNGDFAEKIVPVMYDPLNSGFGKIDRPRNILPAKYWTSLYSLHVDLTF